MQSSVVIPRCLGVTFLEPDKPPCWTRTSAARGVMSYGGGGEATRAAAGQRQRHAEAVRVLVVRKIKVPRRDSNPPAQPAQWRPAFSPEGYSSLTFCQGLGSFLRSLPPDHVSTRNHRHWGYMEPGTRPAPRKTARWPKSHLAVVVSRMHIPNVYSGPPLPQKHNGSMRQSCRCLVK